jgi:DNA-directed RNA polymerase alpha subunit
MMKTPIETLELPKRVLNALKSFGVSSIEDLQGIDTWQLKKIPNIGYAAVKNIEIALKKKEGR